jgi:hypothetical protein
LIQIIKELNIEVTKPNIIQAIVAKQYDMNTRFLKVTLMDCGTRIDVPKTSTAKVVINAERPDGQSKGFDGVINEDGTVTVPLHSWMLELEGTVICDVSVIDTKVDDEKKLTTTSFNLIVEKAAYGGDDVTNDPQYDVLLELIEKVENLSGGEGGPVDQTYNPESSNAQSGKAVAEALKDIDISGIDVSNKMDKFGLVFFLANEKDPSKIDKTYLGIDSPELILSQIIEESGEDTSVILKGVSTPSNASNDAVANKGYVDTAIGDIDSALDSIIAIQNSILGGGA